MKILFAAAEAAPFAKVGGLADVAGSLPKAVKELGHDIRVILPLYGSIDQNKYNLKDIDNSSLVLKFGDKETKVSLKQGKIPNSDVIVYFVNNDEYFGAHKEVYPKEKFARFEQERFIVFSLASLELMKKINFKPDVLHCNDWHTGSMPVYIKTKPEKFKFYSKTAIVYSIHNLCYQGLFSKDILEFANLDQDKLYKDDSLEFYYDISWMKGGIIYSDYITTVSQQYAKEIQTPEYGERLDGLLKQNNYKLTGILNGLDYTMWNPETDSHIPKNYSLKDLAGKETCKTKLQKEYGLKHELNIPLIGLVSRLTDQKGLDLISEIAKDLKNLNLQLIVLGNGQEKYENLLKDLAVKTQNIKVKIGFDGLLAQKIYAGCDMFLMPSKFEPCGLGQLIALRYGTVPIVRKTGGLSDTIIDYISNKNDGNGFVFEEYNSKELLNTINIAIETFHNKKEWKHLVSNAMTSDFSWDKSAKKYIELYQRLYINK